MDDSIESPVAQRRSSILTWIVAVSAASTAAVVIAMASYNWLNVHRLKTDHAAEVIEILMREHEIRIGENFYDRAKIGEIIEEMMEDADGSLTDVLVLKPDGTERWSSGDTAMNRLGPLATQSLTAGTTLWSEDGLGFAVPVLNPNTGAVAGVFVSGWDDSAAEVEVRRMFLKTLGFAVLIFVAGLGLAFLALRRKIVMPLQDLDRSIQRLAESDYRTEVSGTDRADELGRLARNLEKLRLRLIEAREVDRKVKLRAEEQVKVMKAVTSALHLFAAGDLSRRQDKPWPQEYEGLRGTINQTMDRLGGTLGTVKDTAQSILSGVKNLASSSHDMSRRTESQAATLEETAAALDQVTMGLKSAVDDSRNIERIVKDAHRDAAQSDEIVRDAVQAMDRIKDSSDQISRIIGVIDDIAFQTNLLALNAGVEAARAGDAGRGFAVVASEVRALAQRSSDAAREIKTLISSSADQVGEGAALVTRAGTALETIAAHVNHISTLVSGIVSSTVEQSGGLSEINIGMGQLDQVTQQNAAMVEENTGAAQALTNDAVRLEKLVDAFRLTAEESFESVPLNRV